MHDARKEIMTKFCCRKISKLESILNRSCLWRAGVTKWEDGLPISYLVARLGARGGGGQGRAPPFFFLFPLLSPVEGSVIKFTALTVVQASPLSRPRSDGARWDHRPRSPHSPRRRARLLEAHHDDRANERETVMHGNKRRRSSASERAQGNGTALRLSPLTPLVGGTRSPRYDAAPDFPV